MEASTQAGLKSRPLDEHRVLILNAAYEPVRIVGWERAMILWLAEKTEVLESYEKEVHSVNATFRLPSVMRITRFVRFKRNNSRVRFSRLHVFLRDDYNCQYCSKAFHSKELTMDHVIPVVRGGKTTWSNIVTCCVDCNQRKGSKTLQESGLILKRYPKEPHPGFLPDLLYYKSEVPESWKAYLPTNHINFFGSLAG